MQTEDRRACAACGAANRTDAASCWQCFAGFGVSLPPTPDAGGASATGQIQRYRPGFPPPTPVEQAPIAGPSKSLGGSMVLRVVVGLIAAVAGYVGVQRFLGPAVAREERDGVERALLPETV